MVHWDGAWMEGMEWQVPCLRPTRGWSNHITKTDIRRVLLSEIFSLERDNERLRVINHQLKAKCETQRISLAAQKETLISCRQAAHSWISDIGRKTHFPRPNSEPRMFFQTKAPL